MNFASYHEMGSMKAIPIRKGLFGLLILVAVVIAAVTVIFSVALYRSYSNLVYSESAEVLNLYAIVADSKLSEIEALSFEVLSSRDIQTNLRRHTDSTDSFEAFQAMNNLYTQLFTRWILNEGVESITFVFLNGTRVDAGRQSVRITSARLAELVEEAVRLQGSAGWTANAAGKNTVTLYRLIRDISGTNNFAALGTLVINVDANYFLNHTPTLSQRYRPQILAIAGEHALFREPLDVDAEQVLGAVAGIGPSSIVWIDRKPYFVAIEELSTGWDLVYLLSTRELMSSIYDLNLIFGLTLIVALLIVVAIGHRFATGINRPITKLTESMKAVEKGDYKGALADLPRATRFIEVEQLNRGFTQMVREIDRLINEVYSRQLTIMDMRYKMLRQQINPHFLYNTLDTVNWKAIHGGDREIPVIVKSLSRLLRGAIKAPDLVSLEEELNFLADYIRIQQIRFEERLQVEVDVPDAFTLCQIPHLTLQPIVENAIVHNLEKYAGALKIGITARLEGGALHLEVTDDGHGVDLDHVQKVLYGEVEAGRKSIGLRNIHTRIQMSFGEGYGLRVQNRSGTVVTIVLPYEEESHAYRVDSG